VNTTYFLDTNVCIDLLRGKARGRRLPAYAQCQLSSIVAAELWTGAHKSADPTASTKLLQSFLELFTIAPFDAAAGEAYGEIRAQLEKARTPIGSLDQLIAAHGRSAGATLLTANLREFKRVPGLKCHAWE
jgi:tRNA(fMet)-specific endonuclease VapC